MYVFGYLKFIKSIGWDSDKIKKVPVNLIL